MSIIEDYSQQHRWRSWPIILDKLGDLNGQLVMDLGCGIGDLAADLSARGASVIGVDYNEDMINYARSRNIPKAQFHVADLQTYHDPSIQADGIWSSFTAAYFPSCFAEVVASWIEHLRPGGWLAVTEIDDLFGHRPLTDRTRELLNGYVENSLANLRYDFLMGRKIGDVFHQVGLIRTQEFTVPDAELSFSGRAPSQVIQAWQNRFDRMRLLRDFCGEEFEHVRNEFLDCLNRDDHDCDASVQCWMAIKPND